MVSLQTIRKRWVDVTWADIGHIVLFVCALPCVYFFKKKHPDFWLICDSKKEARDNGFALFRYVRESHPEQEVYFAVGKDSLDWAKVAAVGPVVPYGSFKHWVYYLAAAQNISSQKGGKPNAAVCYALEVGGLLKNSRVFLQHGVTKDDMPWLYYNATRFSLFVCAAQPEYEFIKQKFGYPSGAVQLIGFSRFDQLHQDITDKHFILVMPTWRNWFYLKSNNADGQVEAVEGSAYLRTWQAFLDDPTLHQILEKYDLNLLFYPHRDMQPYVHLFSTCHTRITIGNQKEYDVQTLLRRAQLLITDYSSVFFDMIYMKKPILFYQFDEQEFRSRQYSKGYFDYAANPFSCRHTSLAGVLKELEQYAANGFKVSADFLTAHKTYFPLYDTNNCERTYQVIKRGRNE